MDVSTPNTIHVALRKTIKIAMTAPTNAQDVCDSGVRKWTKLATNAPTQHWKKEPGKSGSDTELVYTLKKQTMDASATLDILMKLGVPRSNTGAAFTNIGNLGQPPIKIGKDMSNISDHSMKELESWVNPKSQDMGQPRIKIGKEIQQLGTLNVGEEKVGSSRIGLTRLTS